MPATENALNAWAAVMWGTPLVVRLVGGGIFFVLYYEPPGFSVQLSELTRQAGKTKL